MHFIVFTLLFFTSLSQTQPINPTQNLQSHSAICNQLELFNTNSGKCQNAKFDCECSQGTKWNESKCKCLSTCNEYLQCPSPSFWDEQVCSCVVAVAEQSVMTNFINMPKCSQNPQKCKENQYWSSSRCRYFLNENCYRIFLASSKTIASIGNNSKASPCQSYHSCKCKAFRDSQSQMTTKAIEIYLKKESQLKSYHPHYLTSLSYPYPITPHFYFAEVAGGKTIMYAKDVYDWDPNTISKLAINGVTYEDSSAKYYSFQREQTFKYMLALQIENSYPDSRQSIIHMHNRKDHLLVLTQYENKISAFIICLTRNSSIIPLDVQGIKINLRNQSQGDTKLNWRFSRSLVWKGKNENINPNSINFVGLVLQLQFTDKTVKKDTVLNIYEIESSEKLSLAQFATLQQKLVMSSFLPKTLKIVKRNENCAKAAVQKIFEGLSYQYGTLKIRDSEKIIDNEPKALLSFSPSRKRFPWGFLWDDGFHCEVAVRKDEPLTLKVIKSWLDTMLENGWIPRQQNRGIERQQLCNCPRFMQKDIKDGNPPTLLLALQYLRKQKKLNPNVFQLQYWDKIKRWYGWFMRSQKNQNSYLFRWKDSINQMGASFTSGMDDFPRPINCKAHVDLQSWMFFFANFMAQTSPIYSQDNSEYVNDLKMIKQGFKFFIQDKTKLYKDISVDGFSQHFGYPNILPIAFGIPQFKSQEYNATIAFIIANLDIDAGLASISKRSSLYLQNADAYWKGPVWLNLNYLFLRGLKLYYPKDDRLYKKVRANLLQTVCGNWQKSGYFYQNYIQGRGSFSFPFNGWTSVISIIEQQTY